MKIKQTHSVALLAVVCLIQLSIGAANPTTLAIEQTGVEQLEVRDGKTSQRSVRRQEGSQLDLLQPIAKQRDQGSWKEQDLEEKKVRGLWWYRSIIVLLVSSLVCKILARRLSR